MPLELIRIYVELKIKKTYTDSIRQPIFCPFFVVGRTAARAAHFQSDVSRARDRGIYADFWWPRTGLWIGWGTAPAYKNVDSRDIMNLFFFFFFFYLFLDLNVLQKFFLLFFFLRHESKVSNLLIKIQWYQWKDRSANREVNCKRVTKANREVNCKRVTKAIRETTHHNNQIVAFAPRQVRTLALRSEHTFFYYYIGRKSHSYS